MFGQQKGQLRREILIRQKQMFFGGEDNDGAEEGREA